MSEKRFTGNEPWHGTIGGYAYRKCRCDLCRKARHDKYVDRKEHVLALSKKWKAANAERVKETAKAYRDANRPALDATSQRWREANREHVAALARERRKRDPAASSAASQRYRAANPESVAQANAAYRERNREAYLAAARVTASNYRARKSKATISLFTQAQLNARMTYWGNRCYMCGGPFEAIDHVKPLSKGGAHCLSNLRPICAFHNGSKKDRWHGAEWATALCMALTASELLAPCFPEVREAQAA